jgi:N-acyl homoserine lactone hydrolase
LRVTLADVAPEVEITRLHLAQLTGADGPEPVHGFVLRHPEAGVVLVDTGVGGPQDLLDQWKRWKVDNFSIAAVLEEWGLAPSDVSMVVNSHLHFDHCGQNMAFPHASFFAQRSEYERACREQADIKGWFDFKDASLELLEGDYGLADGINILATPGHTVGHQSVVVNTAHGKEVIVGDALYTSSVFAARDAPSDLPDGQARDFVAWRRSVDRILSFKPRRIHYSHDIWVTVLEEDGARAFLAPFEN